MRTLLYLRFKVLFILALFGYCHGGCTYSDINTGLNNCVDAATTSTTVRWFFPHGTLAQQAEFCQSSAQTTLATCINNIFSACKLEAKSLKMFGTTGDNLINAYTNLCSSSLVTDAQACMSVVSATATFNAAETTFISRVAALPDAATNIEICGLATSMEYVAYNTLLSVPCTEPSHLAVWASFFATVMDTYACTCLASTYQLSHVIMLLTVLLGCYYNVVTRIVTS
ncbi:uncharacterized protein LOC132720682 [Ruditapes philippinarum]|uniref:uncharacterized protein LOC132720682 n=1 Tax=Ruditapes philippinarum TaxID=129788 RepID=UPI00295AFAF9|nr:uncharacterized protein LOC132720682 [Ruditapes philippinarum]